MRRRREIPPGSELCRTETNTDIDAKFVLRASVCDHTFADCDVYFPVQLHSRERAVRGFRVIISGNKCFVRIEYYKVRGAAGQDGAVECVFCRSNGTREVCILVGRPPLAGAGEFFGMTILLCQSVQLVQLRRTDGHALQKLKKRQVSGAHKLCDPEGE